MNEKINAAAGMLYYIVHKIRPGLAKRIAKSNTLETLIVGMGGQGSKHAGLMYEFGTTVAAGVAPEKGGSRIHEVIPVYNTVKDALSDHPDIVACSIWRHYATAKDAAIEAIQSGIPLIVLITEGIPLKDVRDILVSARENNTVLIGGNTPGLIFPPERIKIGMLPDVFYPEELESGRNGSRGVTILSRSGAILYHMSDAMASVGIAQNAVIGIGGDGAIGSTFRDLVPLAMDYENTDLVVVAGEIGGCQEELLAEDIQDHPEKYPKPLVALISGAHAPEGKTMGHAGAIVTPGLGTGTYSSKKSALEAAGIQVVNSQFDLIKTVQDKLKGKIYFQPERYYNRMRMLWEAPPPKPSWSTRVTKVEPNNLVMRGYKLQELIQNASLLSSVHCIIDGELPDKKTESFLQTLVLKAIKKPVPLIKKNSKEDISKTLQKYILCDDVLVSFNPGGKSAQVEKTVFCLGRVVLYLSHILSTESILEQIQKNRSFSDLICSVITGKKEVNADQSRILEAIIVASLDHGVTPPSAQATILASSVRASYEVAVAQGVGAITDVHGGAGQKAAEFFRRCADLVKTRHFSLEDAARNVMSEYVKTGRRIEGMGHRVHTQDPRRDVMWDIAEKHGLAGQCVAISRIASTMLKEVRGLDLPINVDGVIGAIIADMGLDPRLAKALFIFGRIAGLSAHYFEEIMTQNPMRRIDFSQAVYRGVHERDFPATKYSF
jgi:succinyl-CoA synthetase alpha subunit